MIRQFNVWSYLLAVLLLAGCASFTAPQTAEERLAYVDGQFTAVVQTAADLRESGSLTAEQAREIDPYIQEGNRALDMAWAAVGEGDTETTLDYVRVVNRLLVELQTKLQEASNDSN